MSGSERTPLLNGRSEPRTRELLYDPTWLESYQFFVFGSWFNVLLFFIPLSFLSHFLNWDAALRFTFSFMAIIPLAKVRLLKAVFRRDILLISESRSRSVAGRRHGPAFRSIGTNTVGLAQRVVWKCGRNHRWGGRAFARRTSHRADFGECGMGALARDIGVRISCFRDFRCWDPFYRTCCWSLAARSLQVCLSTGSIHVTVLTGSFQKGGLYFRESLFSKTAAQT